MDYSMQSDGAVLVKRGGEGYFLLSVVATKEKEVLMEAKDGGEVENSRSSVWCRD